MLGDLCAAFQVEVEALDPGADDHATELRALVIKLARDAAGHVADHPLGEIPALLQRAHDVLAALSAEAEDAEDRQRRYERQQAVLGLLMLAEAVCRFHEGRRRAADVAAFRGVIADALAGVVERDECPNH